MRTILLLILSFNFFTQVYSQNIPLDHNYALVFGISNNFTIEKFNLNIAGKLIIDETKELRLLFSPSVNTSSNESTSGLTGDVIKVVDSWSHSFKIALDHIWTLKTSGDFALFSGVGLAVSLYNQTVETTDEPNGKNWLEENETNSIGGGIRGTIGSEWHVNDNIGIHGEYILSGMYFKQETGTKLSREGRITPAGSTISKGFELDSEVLFGVSIYF